jgi:hypothetical protein
MSDVLIRDVPDGVLKVIDANAARLGISRSQYLRRKLSQDAEASLSPVTADDLRAFSASVVDLDDDQVMSAAWR